ncbi:MAG: 2-amino-4-hydroxy-6-hydroxymethyldihydropteridine diphosphokinase [Rhodocyclaceae bacterium]
MSVIAYVALGANLGEPEKTVRAAIWALQELPRARLLKCSSLYRTAPVGLKHQPDFINAVAMLETAWSPNELLARLFEIEARFGRVRSIRNAPRTLDLDLLLCGDQMIESAELTLPHPRMTERAFVLVPLTEIAPQLTIPGRGPLSALLPQVADQRIERLS